MTNVVVSNLDVHEVTWVKSNLDSWQEPVGMQPVAPPAAWDRFTHQTHPYIAHDHATHHHKNRQHLRKRPQDHRHLIAPETPRATAGLSHGIRMTLNAKIESIITQTSWQKVGGTHVGHGITMRTWRLAKHH